MSDVWSLGCCIIEMVTGKPPWSEYGNDAETIMKIIENTKEPPKIPEQLGELGVNFVSYCLDLDPSKRPDVNILLMHPFVGLVTDEMVQKSHNTSI